jgi:hypothetical protein
MFDVENAFLTVVVTMFVFTVLSVVALMLAAIYTAMGIYILIPIGILGSAFIIGGFTGR